MTPREEVKVLALPEKVLRSFGFGRVMCGGGYAPPAAARLCRGYALGPYIAVRMHSATAGSRA